MGAGASAAADPTRWRGGERLDPARTVLCVFDLLEIYRAQVEATGVIPRVRQLADTCRARGVLVAWARADHRGNGVDLARSLSDLDGRHQAYGPEHPRPSRAPAAQGSPPYRTLRELGQRSEDVDVPKHRWSALEGTCLQATMRTRGADTLLLVIGSTHVGIAATCHSFLTAPMLLCRESSTASGRMDTTTSSPTISWAVDCRKSVPSDVVEFFLFLVAAITVVRRLINTARVHYRWGNRPTTTRLP